MPAQEKGKPLPGSGGKTKLRAVTPSINPARSQRLSGSLASATGVVSARNCSTAAITAAASSGEAAVEVISIRGRGGLRFPLLAIAANPR